MIVKTLLDTDLYKFTTSYAYIKLFPYAMGTFSFNDRGSLRPWKREEKYVNRYWLIQPEYKYWTCQKFNGFFWGAYLNGAQFNIGGKKLPFGIFAGLKKYRYEGWLAGGGISAADT